jgi:hypothetical protein
MTKSPLTFLLHVTRWACSPRIFQVVWLICGFYKPWPIIAHFLSTLPAGSVGLDSGTGNGKYLPLPLDRPSGSIYTIGLDRSRNLLEIARTAGADADDTFATKRTFREVIWGDIIGKGWRDGAFVCAFRFSILFRANLCIRWNQTGLCDINSYNTSSRYARAPEIGCEGMLSYR